MVWYLLDELERLMWQEAKSLPELIDYIHGLPLEVPPRIAQVLRPIAVKEEEASVARHRAGPREVVSRPVSPVGTENASVYPTGPPHCTSRPTDSLLGLSGVAALGESERPPSSTSLHEIAAVDPSRNVSD